MPDYDRKELDEIDAQLEMIEAEDGKTPNTLAACARLLEGLKDSDWLSPLARVEIRERLRQHEANLGAMRPEYQLSDEAVAAVVESKIAEVEST
ncbi:MAG: hypothetical protein KIS92_01035 [Planctomycetota bacterium]|nr:hypothetical protein [Planctomycetota bacterium]